MNQMVCKELQNYAQNKINKIKIKCKWREKHKQKQKRE
jgi:hypothetical protein